jgi:3-dehydroquinate synthase
MQSIIVPLGDRSYTISIGRGLRKDAALLAPFVRKRVAIVTNDVVGPLYLADLQQTLAKCGADSFPIVLPDGEQHKDWVSLNAIFDALLENHCERTTPLIALGGGVIGDTVGFAAASYQRGAPFIQMPTTLLSQVDSSVGGKTAINHPRGKNMIGAFYQPKRVLIDTETLATLPTREFSAGMAEVIKYGLIRDPGFFEWLEENIDSVMARTDGVVQEAIARSCQNKADVVVADETEQGERATLNLGHTFGHAIETGLGYGEWLHGEAVAAGTMIAAQLSQRLGWLAASDVERISRLFVRAGLPVMGPQGLASARYLELMAHDKKVSEGKLRLILLKSIGKAQIYGDARREDMAWAIEERTARN